MVSEVTIHSTKTSALEQMISNRVTTYHPATISFDRHNQNTEKQAENGASWRPAQGSNENVSIFRRNETVPKF